MRTDQAKPNLVAPGTRIIPYDSQKAYGTRFSSPLVTSAIAGLMRNYPDYQSHPWRIPALISATSDLKRFGGQPLLGKQTNFGFDNAYGSGLFNYKNRIENADNVQDFQFDINNGVTEFDSKPIFLTETSNLKISAFWYVSASEDLVDEELRIVTFICLMRMADSLILLQETEPTQSLSVLKTLIPEYILFIYLVGITINLTELT